MVRIINIIAAFFLKTVVYAVTGVLCVYLAPKLFYIKCTELNETRWSVTVSTHRISEEFTSMV